MSTSNLAAIDVGGGISSAWTAVATFVPKLVAFLVIMLIGWIIAKVLGKIVGKILAKVGFNRAVERGSLKGMLDRANYDASTLIAKVVYYAILLIALEVAFGVFGPNPISTILTAIVAWLPKLIVAMLIIIVVGAIAKAVKDLVSNALSGLSYGRLLGTIASVFIWGLGIIAALNQIGIATAVTTPVLITVLATVGGIAVVGFGGGLIRPMQQRWETWINRAEQELPSAQGHGEAYQRGREDAARSGRPQSERTESGRIESGRTESGRAEATAAYQSAQPRMSGSLGEQPETPRAARPSGRRSGPRTDPGGTPPESASDR